MRANDENLDVFKPSEEDTKLMQLQEQMKQEMSLRLEGLKFCLESEETERKSMAVEDDHARRYVIDCELHRTKKPLEEQISFSKQYSRIMFNVVDPPPLLQRLQYNMGSALDGGGIRVMCMDPTTRGTLEVISIPMLYPEDEEAFTIQMTTMLGKVHLHQIRMIDYSVHQLRKFTHTGFTSADERVALVVTDFPVGPLFGDYIKMQWGSMSNNVFRLLLVQIVSALMALHRDKLIHRNIHPGCVRVQLPESIPFEAEESEFEGEDKPKLKLARYRHDKPVCKLGDYWFLHNPRKSGCVYSHGRADWGTAATAAPEVLLGAPISENSDIWALGICVYNWATQGLYPNFNVESLEDLKEHIPLKWGSWLHSLLRMTLQQNKDYRASAEELFNFLTVLKLK